MTREYVIAKFLKLKILNSEEYKQRDRKFYVIAATLDKRGQIIAVGKNSPIKTHPLMSHYSSIIKNCFKIYLHAEVSALVKSQRPVDTMIVVRVNKQGEMALAKPCEVCQLAIKDANLKKVYYTNNNGELVLLA